MRISKCVGILHNMRFIQPKKTVLKAYKSFIRSYIRFDSDMWFFSLQKINKQNFRTTEERCLSYMFFFLPYDRHISEIFESPDISK